MKLLRILFIGLLVVLIVVGAVLLLNYFYDSSSFLQKAFGNPALEQSGIRVPTDEPGGESNFLSPSVGGKFSMIIFTVILLMQLFSFALATKVFLGLAKKDADFHTKDELFKNADIFCDLPLYIGLFGTVSSFLLISFSPQSSRLVAYSSTLIGIIFSVSIRLILVYPAKQAMLGKDKK